MVNFVYTFVVGTLFIQMWSILIHLRVVYTIVVDFICLREVLYICGIYTFEGPTMQAYETLPSMYCIEALVYAVTFIVQKLHADGMF